MITLSAIKTLNPCKDRLDNFVKFYGSKTLTKGQFMGLKNITQEDKMWVAFRMMPQANIRYAAADIAESVLHIFEKEYPNDNRPRRAIEVAKNPNSTQEELNSARANAAAAYAAYATYAANAAAANALAANSAATYAAYATYATYAATAAANAATNRAAQDKLNRKIVLKYWKE
jgi:hypothetical protein